MHRLWRAKKEPITRFSYLKISGRFEGENKWAGPALPHHWELRLTNRLLAVRRRLWPAKERADSNLILALDRTPELGGNEWRRDREPLSAGYMENSHRFRRRVKRARPGPLTPM